MEKIYFGRTLSISNLNNIKNTLSQLKENDFVFISLHIFEEVDNGYVEKCKKLCDIINSYKLRIIADVSKKTKDFFHLPLSKIALLLNLYALRIDYGVSLEEIIDISNNNIVIAINASTCLKQDIIEIKKITSNIIAMHNYYPRPETGLDFDYFKKQNDLCLSYGIKVYAFIKGSSPYRLPLRKGLPTLEKHRLLAPHVSFIELAKNSNLSGIFIGDPNLNQKENELIRLFLDKNIIPLKVKVNKHFYHKTFTNRIDSPQNIIRIKESREYSCFGKKIVPENILERKKGSITIDNELYSRYSGEMMILRADFKKDEKVNVIGKVKKESLPLLKYIDGNDKFIFIP